MKKLVEVVVGNNSHNTDKLFTYEVPSSEVCNIIKGQRVMVPFGRGNKPAEAYVFEVLENREVDFNVKSLIEIVDYEPVLNSWQIELVKWMRKSYICTYMDCVSVMIPKGIGVEKYKIVKLTSEDGEPGCENERAIISTLREKGPVKLEKLKSIVENAKKHIKKLEKNGIIEIEWDYKKLENKKYLDVVSLCMGSDEIDLNIEELKRQRAHKQAGVVEFLRYNDECIKGDLQKITGASPATIKSLQKKGFISIKREEVYREPDEPYSDEAGIIPNEEQRNAVAYIESRISKRFEKPVVLHGVTGSGKTQVYMDAIEKVISAGKESIMLVPEISLTPQTVSRFKARFGDSIAIIHSGLSVGEKYDQWRKMKNGNAKVCIGARSAIFSPFENIGLIIIDEFHESSYKSEMAPKYDTIEVAKNICKLTGSGLVLGSATPSVKEYYRCKNGECDIIKLEKRANSKRPPNIEVIDMKQEIGKGNAGIFSSRFLKLLKSALERKEQAIIFLNKRGYSSFMSCRECGFVLKCKRCDISMTYHKDIDRVKCHYCGESIRVPKKCPECGLETFEAAGIGTQKVVDEVKRFYPNARILRMDKDTTSRKGAHSRIIQKFKENSADILIGTQMISKGHDFSNVTFVGIVSGDDMLNYPDYKSSERTFQLITQVAGRAGRASLEGIVALQVYDTAHYAVQYAKGYNYEGFYNEEIRVRKAFSYEPFGNMLSIVVSGKMENLVANNAYKIHEALTYVLAKRGFEDFSFIMGPGECPVYRINGNYRWHIVIKDSGIELDFLKGITRFVCVTKRSKIVDDGVNISISINPENVM